MIINFKGAKTYIGTGGKSLDVTKMTLCFLHGAGQNHLSFIQQARFFAYKGYSVCLLYTSPSPRDRTRSRMPSSA